MLSDTHTHTHTTNQLLYTATKLVGSNYQCVSAGRIDESCGRVTPSSPSPRMGGKPTMTRPTTADGRSMSRWRWVLPRGSRLHLHRSDLISQSSICRFRGSVMRHGVHNGLRVSDHRVRFVHTVKHGFANFSSPRHFSLRSSIVTAYRDFSYRRPLTRNRLNSLQ